MYPVAILGQKLGQPDLALVAADHLQMQRSHRHPSFSLGYPMCAARKRCLEAKESSGWRGRFRVKNRLARFHFSGFTEFLSRHFSAFPEVLAFKKQV